MSIQIKHRIGEKIGKYTVIDIQFVKNKSLYLVKCECGNEKKLPISYLRKFIKCRYCNSLSFIGKKNYKTTFLKFIGKNNYECLCDCGKLFIGRRRSKSCGCHKEENYIIDAEKFNGIKFNGIKIIKFSHFEKRKGKSNLRRAVYKALCDCGNFFLINRNRIFKNKSCGCRIINNHAKGEKQGNNKYSENEVKTARELFLSGEYTRKEISEMMRIKLGALNSFINTKSWNHLKVDKNILKNSPIKHKFAKKIEKIEIGKIYGFWKIIDKSLSRNKQAYYSCECTLCKKKYEVTASALRSGKSTKCYWCNSKNLINLTRKYIYDESIIGKKFVSRTILSVFYEDKQNKGFVKCDCGFEQKINLYNVVSLKTRCPKCFQRKRKKKGK